MNVIKALLLLLVLGALGVAAFVYLGVFNTAADAPHAALVYELMQTVRERSIAVRASAIQVPPLEDPKLVSEGAEHYAAMCAGCHLAPGVTDSEIRAGLYPQPPNLSQPLDASPAEMFWVIKHGIKMSAMPAWGKTHDNQTIWAIVALVRKLPAMSPEQYRELTRGTDGQEQGEHHHHGDTSAHAGDVPESGEAGEHHHEHGDTLGDAADGQSRGETSQSSEDALWLKDLKAQAVPDAEQVASAFHASLQNGDRTAALALLSADVTITEAGHTQTRAEYASGHLGEDIAYLEGAEVKTISLASMRVGETAIVGTETEIRKTIDGQSKVQSGREMLTLKRENGSWKIVSIRWQ